VLGEAAEERHEVIDYQQELLGITVYEFKKFVHHEQVLLLQLLSGHGQHRQHKLAKEALCLHGDLEKDALDDRHRDLFVEAPALSGFSRVQQGQPQLRQEVDDGGPVLHESSLLLEDVECANHYLQLAVVELLTGVFL